MARSAKAKSGKGKRKIGARRTKVARKPVKRRRAAAPPARLSRDAVEELLVHSAKAAEGEQLTDSTLAEIARCAGLDPEQLLDAHRRLCAAVEDAGTTVLRVVELWEPDD